MTVVIRANKLPRSSDGPNIVRAVSYLGSGIALQPPEEEGVYREEWVQFRDEPGAEPVKLVTARSLELQIENLLIAAADGTGVLTIRLHNGERLVVPRHHWPVFEVTDR